MFTVMKLCMGCMEEIEDAVSRCPYCGYNEREDVRESFYLLPGTVVSGKYIVGKAEGYGGFGITYMGWDAEAERKVVIKEYMPSDFATRAKGELGVTIYSGDAKSQFEEGLGVFLNEANQIQHVQNAKGIAKVYDCCAENDTGYVIAEYLEGESLQSILDGGKTYPFEEAREVLLPILDGLIQVHAMGVVHYDVEPGNIFVNAVGEAKLTGFGAVKYAAASNSKSLAMMLRRGYAPEEQYRSKMEDRGPWSDVYAMGAVLYRMVTGVTPEESVERAMDDKLEEPSKMQGAWLPPSGENAIMNSLNVERKYRTPSMERFREELVGDDVKRIHPKKKRFDAGKIPTWAKVAMAALCLLVVGLAWFGMKKGKDSSVQLVSSENEMPLLIGKTEEEARAVFEGSRLAEELQGHVFNVVYDCDIDGAGTFGQVEGQEPKAGDSAEYVEGAQAVITLRVNGGTEKVTIADVQGREIEKAKEILEGRHFNMENVTEEKVYGDGYGGVGKGLVAEVVSLGGQSDGTAGIHDGVILRRSLGNMSDYEYVIPNFEGKTRVQMEKECEELFKKQNDYVIKEHGGEEYHEAVKKDGIISQNVAAGEKRVVSPIEPLTITFIFSKGPNLIAIPNVRGKTYAEAKRILEAQGFVVNAPSDQGNPNTSVSEDFGNVVSVRIVGSRSLSGHKGDKVDVFLAKAPQTQTVRETTRPVASPDSSKRDGPLGLGED